MKCLLLALTIALVQADLPPGRTLASPDFALCQQRTIHEVGPGGKLYPGVVNPKG